MKDTIIKEPLPEKEYKVIPRTDDSVDNSAIEIKRPYIQTDDYGNEKVLFKKEQILVAEIIRKKESVQADIETLQDQLLEYDAILSLYSASL